MAISKYLQVSGKREDLPILLGMECRAIMEDSTAVPQQIKYWAITWSGNPIIGYISKGNESRILKG